MYNKLLKVVTNLDAPKVLLVGDFILDSYVYGDALRISPEAPVPVLRVKDRRHCCGGAASVAADVLALGGQCDCLGVIGKDDNGKLLKKLLTEAGADITGLVELKTRPTISKQRLIGLAQHRHRQQLLRMDEESTDPLDEDQCDKILKIYKNKLPKVDIVCLQDYNKGLLSCGLCAEMIRSASDAGKKVLIDPAMSADYSKYAGASLVTPNRFETSQATGLAIEAVEDAAKAADQLRKKLSLEAVVVTLDKEGALLCTSRASEHIPTIPRNVYDVSGAGDMVLATLAVTIASGCDHKTSVQLANIAGGLEVEKFGTATVTIDELVNEIVAESRGKAGKTHDIESLTIQLQMHRQQNEKIVFTNGCFDVLHRGHIEYLRFCKQQGDLVVLGLNSDTSVRKIKGKGRPINNQFDRSAVLAALETVDYIIIFDEPDPLKTVEKVRPDILVKGVDWAEKGVIGREFVESHGGKVVLAPLVEGKSSTDTINKMRSVEEQRSK